MTKYGIAEQVSLKLYGGAPKVSSPVQMPDIILAVGQACNALIKPEHFESLQLGENQPQNLVIATYNDIPLTSFGGKKSKATLPVMPVGLIRNMGVWMVSTSPYFDCLLIPIMSGQSDLLRGQDLISDLMGQTGYEVNGKDIITTKDLTIDNVSVLHMRLIVTDVASLTDYDPLPIPANYEAIVVDMVYKSFMPVQPQVRVNDNYAAAPQPQNR